MGRQKSRFIGYGNNSKGYRLYDEVRNKVITRRDVIFNETEFSMNGAPKHSVEDLNTLFPMESSESENENSESLESVVQDATASGPEAASQESCPTVDVPEQHVRKPKRSHNLPDRCGKLISCTDTCKHFAYRVSEVPQPKTMDEALSSQHAEEWKEASRSEYQSLMDNNTWDLVELPEGKEAIGCKWVFKVKHNSEGEVERFKCHLVAKGYSQRYGVDFEETFAPVVRFSSIRTLLAFAVNKDMIVHQMDVVTAFLNGELQEEIYMQQPRAMKLLVEISLFAD